MQFVEKLYSRRCLENQKKYVLLVFLLSHLVKFAEQKILLTKKFYSSRASVLLKTKFCLLGETAAILTFNLALKSTKNAKILKNEFDSTPLAIKFFYKLHFSYRF